MISFVLCSTDTATPDGNGSTEDGPAKPKIPRDGTMAVTAKVCTYMYS